MKSSFRSLIPFLPFLPNRLRLPHADLDPLLDNNSPQTTFCPFIRPRHGPRRKHILSIAEKACLLIRCLAIDVLLSRVGSRGNVFTESLPSNGSIRHNIIKPNRYSKPIIRSIQIISIAPDPRYVFFPSAKITQGRFLRYLCLRNN
jgi:hypothetical protein